MPTAGSALPVNSGLWLAALSPIVVLLLLLVWRRWNTAAAAPAALAAAAVAALLLFRLPWRGLAVAGGKGIWDAIAILYIVWPALILYDIADDAGAFIGIQRAVRRLMPDRLLVVLTFAWLLTSFIQGIAGFGTPLAVTGPLLVGLGVQPVYAVLLTVIGGAWANAFGSLGAAWLAMVAVVEIPDVAATLTYAAILLWIPNLTAALAIAWVYGRWWGIRRAAPAIAVLSLIHGGGQLILLPLVPTIGTFLVTAAALVAAFALSRWSYYRREDTDEPQFIFTERAKRLFNTPEEGAAADAAAGGSGSSPARVPSLPLAFAPYAILGVLAILVLLVPPVNAFLEQFQVGPPFPAVGTGYGVEQPAVETYAPIAPLTHPGTLLLISAAVGYVLYSLGGYYERGATVTGILRQAAGNALPATTAISALLIISRVMDHSGQVQVLAVGISAAAPQLLYVAAANFVGILGSFITSSATASNALFAPLQAAAAGIEEVPVELALAAQMAGSAVGNAIAPGDVLLGATVVGVADALGEVLSRALRWTLVTGVLVSAGTLAIYLLARAT